MPPKKRREGYAADRKPSSNSHLIGVCDRCPKWFAFANANYDMSTAVGRKGQKSALRSAQKKCKHGSPLPVGVQPHHEGEGDAIDDNPAAATRVIDPEDSKRKPKRGQGNIKPFDDDIGTQGGAAPGYDENVAACILYLSHSLGDGDDRGAISRRSRERI
jgi:hypothetical protein